MVFFQSKPNLPDGEKAKVEFHLQQMADNIGFDRFRLPVQEMESILMLAGENDAVREIVSFTGKHLGHDTIGLQVHVSPQQLEKCGGGG